MNFIISRVKSEDDLPELISQRNEYTDKIKFLRKHLRNANAVMERSDKVMKTIQAVQRHEEGKQQKQNNAIVKNSFIR